MRNLFFLGLFFCSSASAGSPDYCITVYGMGVKGTSGGYTTYCEGEEPFRTKEKGFFGGKKKRAAAREVINDEMSKRGMELIGRYMKDQAYYEEMVTLYLDRGNDTRDRDQICVVGTSKNRKKSKAAPAHLIDCKDNAQTLFLLRSEKEFAKYRDENGFQLLHQNVADVTIISTGQYTNKMSLSIYKKPRVSVLLKR